ncbi:MAG TPA: VOC family protein, partial [Acidimicrobiales bacterium]
AAVLDLREDDQEAVDAGGRWPTVWFQATEQRASHVGEHRQRWHADVRVPPEVVQERIARVLEAGGTLVTDDHAPAFWVLEDPQGNRACLTTWLGRGPGPAA